MLLSGSLNGANPRLVSGRRGLILAILWGRKGGARAEVEGEAKSGAKAGASEGGGWEYSSSKYPNVKYA